MGLVTSAATVLLPKIPPDGNQLNAQPPRRTAAGEENLAPIMERSEQRVRDLLRPPRLRELAILPHYVVVHVEQKFQPGGDVAFRHFAEIRCGGMGRLGR